MTFSSSGHQTFIWIRERSVSWSMLNRIVYSDSVAVYSLTGMVTRPNWMAPFHIERATGVLRPRTVVRATPEATLSTGQRLYHSIATARIAIRARDATGG